MIVLPVVKDEKIRKRVEKLGAVDYLVKSELKLNEIVERVWAHFDEE